MKIIALILALLLNGCASHPLEPVATDVCIDTFSAAGGRTYTFGPGEPIVIPPQPEPPVVRMDSLTTN